jgi:membrane protein DedA with SNARE-associated domain
MMDSLLAVFSDPQHISVYWLFLSIILLSYLLEDLAIITAALFAADQTLPAPAALLAIFIGIASGDIALYGVGLLAARWRYLRYRLLTNRRMRQVRSRLRYRPVINIALIRFIPGLRTLGFTLSGLFKIHFGYFFLSVMTATALWTAFIFTCVYQLGSAAWLLDSLWRWTIAPGALLLLWLANRFSSHKAQPSSG